MLKAVSSITNALGALNYAGTWNANTNVPALASGVGTKGDYYVVSTAGTTNLDGITSWNVGDWAVFNGSVWQRLEGGVDDPALSVKSNSTTGLMQITGPAAGQTRVVTIPDANATMARTDAAQSFTGDQTLATGNLVIGTAGKGIDFSATPGTGTSELLDDYEEGTWTTVWQGGVNVTGTPTFTNGKYTKIGRQVTLQGTWNATVTTGSTEMYGAFTIPFARDEAADRTVGIASGYSNWRVGLMSTGSPTTTTLYIVFPAASAVPAGADTFNFCVTYFTTT